MKKNNNKKGFTLTELLIVIVIIGILAGVLIPTFASFINRAHKSAAEQEALAIYQDYLVNDNDDRMVDLMDQKVVVLKDGYYVEFEQGALKSSSQTKPAYWDAAISVSVPEANKPYTNKLGENAIILIDATNTTYVYGYKAE